MRSFLLLPVLYVALSLAVPIAQQHNAHGAIAELTSLHARGGNAHTSSTKPGGLQRQAAIRRRPRPPTADSQAGGSASTQHTGDHAPHQDPGAHAPQHDTSDHTPQHNPAVHAPHQGPAVHASDQTHDSSSNHAPDAAQARPSTGDTSPGNHGAHHAPDAGKR